jgi:hypothetical protein
VYYRHLADRSRQEDLQRSLAPVLEDLFVLARRRCDAGEPAVDEHRALLLALGVAVMRSDPGRLAGDRVAGMSVRYLGLRLRGRQDLAQHFVISAALAVAGGDNLADAIGLFKELDDADGGSGFSFVDLLADRAGVELALAATGSRAREVQALLAGRPGEGAIMPPIDDLPEGLMAMAFRARYRDLDDARFGAVKREIDTRIAVLPLHSGAR